MPVQKLGKFNQARRSTERRISMTEEDVRAYRLGNSNILPPDEGVRRGLTTFSRDLGGKRFELITEVVQRLTRVGVRNPDERTATREVFEEYKTAARAANIQIQSVEVGGPDFYIDEAFQN